MFTYLYWTVSLLLYILSLPLILYKQRKPRYKERIPARYFLKNNPKFSKKGIWFHSCSLGETRGLQPIIERIDDTLNMSVITNTGYKEAEKIAPGNARYLPYEIFLPFWITPQKLLVVTESEYWYLLFYIARKRGAKTMLVNARISDKHYDRYRRFSWFYCKVFAQIDIIFAQSIKDKERLEHLGARNIHITGNTKLTNIPKVTHAIFKPEGKLIVAASTHDTEEALILSSWKREQGRLVIVPRHPERFDAVDRLIQTYIGDTSLSYHRYSAKENLNADIVLVDKMGELVNIYAISDVVILGGGFVPGVGGHNPVEPAYFDNILITGELIYNEISLYGSLEHYTVIQNEALPQTLAQLDSLEACRITQPGNIEPIMAYINQEVYGGAHVN